MNHEEIKDKLKMAKNLQEEVISALWHKKYNNEYQKLMELICRCKRGHDCNCDKETKLICEALSKRENKQLFFYYVLDYLRTISFKIEWALVEKKKEKNKDSETIEALEKFEAS